MKKTPEDTIILHLHTINDDHMCGSWDIWNATDIIFCHFGLFFCPFTNPKNQNFEKMKKTPVDIIILHIYTINENHMMHVSWDMEHDRHNFSHFGPFFALLPH